MEKERYDIPEDTPQMVSETVAVRDTFRGITSMDKTPEMKSYERARADVEAGRIIEFESVDALKAYLDQL